MTTRILILSTVFFASLIFAANPQSKEAQSNMTTSAQPQTAQRTHAKTRVTVQNSQVIAYDHTANPALTEIHITEAFAGDIEGESTVRALQFQRADKSASQVSMQRVRGKIAGRQGAFVLQGSETVENGKIKAIWFVVPGSGTDGLVGLRGVGGFEGSFGRGSDGWLDYWFESEH
jgi:ABC-type enterochelin transport system substrate-binding protein